MHEFQAYFFLWVMYPFIFFYADLFYWFHISISPVLMIWLLIDNAMLIDGVRADGTGIPRENYARVYAEVDAIT